MDSVCQTLDRATFKRLLLPLEIKFQSHSDYVEQRPAYVRVVDEIQSKQPEVVALRNVVLQSLHGANVAADEYISRLNGTHVMREQVG